MSRDTLHEEAEPLADLFAAHAASALERTREVSELNTALESRKIIGQAIGIVMERYGLNEDRAFAFLVRASSHGNVKIRDLALRLVNECNARCRHVFSPAPERYHPMVFERSRIGRWRAVRGPVCHRCA